MVIDAYNGTTDYYIVDDTDPIAQNFKKIYHSLFKGQTKIYAGRYKRRTPRYPTHAAQHTGAGISEISANDIIESLLSE